MGVSLAATQQCAASAVVPWGRVGSRAELAGCAEHEHTVATHPCEWAHEGETCSYAAFKFFPGAYLRALPVYLPVYVLPAILVHRCHHMATFRSSH